MIPYNVFQTAYVTADIDAAVAIAAKRFGAPEMQVNRGVPIETGRGIAHCHFALAFIGDVQLELIQPAGGEDAVYRDLAPPTGLRLHHIGVLLASDAEWDAVVAEAERENIAMPVSGDFAGLMRYLYLDRRAELGHYLEYMQASAAGANLFDQVPRFPGPPCAARR